MTMILLVEDEVELAGILRRELEAAGYQVAYAPGGEQALHRFSSQTPDLVILDWILPGMDGLEVLRQIRKTSAVPVLMLTARGDPLDRVVGLEVGADDYLIKPFNLPELIARVRALLRRAERIRAMLAGDQAPPVSILHYGGLHLDPQAYTCTLNDRSLDLTHIEFELLRLFMTNPGRTFNRIYLVETIWNATYLEGDRSVDNTILRLRKKLGPLEDCLETVRGVGYRLRPPLK